MAFAHSTGNHEYWYDPDKKEFVLTLFKNNEDGKDRSYLIKPDNIVQAATMLDEYGDEDFSLYDMLKFLKDNNVMDDYASVAKELAERYSDQPPVWLDEGNIDSALGLIDNEPDSSDDSDYDAGFADVQNSEDPTAPAGKSNRYYDGWNDGLFEKNNTKVGGIAKALTANDLGRSL